jgi:hypothetical protein
MHCAELAAIAVLVLRCNKPCARLYAETGRLIDTPRLT